MAKITGKVSQILGAVVDVEFSSDSKLPRIYDSLEIKREDGSILILEVEQHIGEDTVRCIAMDSVDGLSRGVEVVSEGNPIKVPVGDEIYGRLFNVNGDPIDGLKALPKDGDNGLPIHRSAPRFEDLSTSTRDPTAAGARADAVISSGTRPPLRSQPPADAGIHPQNPGFLRHPAPSVQQRRMHEALPAAGRR